MLRTQRNHEPRNQKDEIKKASRKPTNATTKRKNSICHDDGGWGGELPLLWALIPVPIRNYDVREVDYQNRYIRASAVRPIFEKKKKLEL